MAHFQEVWPTENRQTGQTKHWKQILVEKKYLLGKERLARAGCLLPMSSADRAHSPEKRWLTPFSCGPRKGFFIMFAERVWLVEAKRFEHVWLYFCIPGSLGHWGGRQGWFHRNSVAQLSSGKSWKFCLSASCWEHSWATESPFHLLPGLFLGSEPPCGLSSQRDF